VSREVLESLRGELRRGSLVIAVLCALEVEQNGTDLKSCLRAADVEISEGALYPMLRRLETQGLLQSEWRLDDSRKKRFYALSEEGRNVRDALLADWREFETAFGKLRTI
jgi:PadR family transcriptional regulator, regulatory protein PadR